MPVPCFKTRFLRELDDGTTYHLNGRKTDFGRARIQAAAQGKRLRLGRLSRNVPPVDADRWRAREHKVRRHAVIPHQHLTNFRHNTFRIQNVSRQLHGGRMGWALCDVQNLDFHRRPQGANHSTTRSTQHGRYYG
jgi:hypothetical protein